MDKVGSGKLDYEEATILYQREASINEWSVEQLLTNRISSPISKYIISRWMKRAELKYEKYNKYKYVDRHKDGDVVGDCKS